ncbi:MAG: TetR/AcrR family transcriptional regulator [Myxococcaceae bacterium]|nr:TetR/AcrR family transcriptional regulator [Myxococcaceae bacterium]
MRNRVPKLPSPRRTYQQVARAHSTQETEHRVVEAATQLFAERFYDDVHLEDVARLAGVTVKTIQRRFGGKEGLARAFLVAAGKHNAALRDRVPAGDPEVAVDFILGMYEPLGDTLMRTLALDGRVPVVTEMAETGRALHWGWLQRVFGPLLSAEQAARQDQLAALLIATDVYTWKLLRRDRGLSPARTRAVLLQFVTDALSRPTRRPSNREHTP